MTEALTFGQLATAVFCGNVMTLGAFYSLRALWDVKDGQKVPKLPGWAFVFILGLAASQMITALP